MEGSLQTTMAHFVGCPREPNGPNCFAKTGSWRWSGRRGAAVCLPSGHLSHAVGSNLRLATVTSTAHSSMTQNAVHRVPAALRNGTYTDASFGVLRWGWAECPQNAGCVHEGLFIGTVPFRRPRETSACAGVEATDAPPRGMRPVGPGK